MQFLILYELKRINLLVFTLKSLENHMFSDDLKGE